MWLYDVNFDPDFSVKNFIEKNVTQIILYPKICGIFSDVTINSGADVTLCNLYTL